MMQNTNYGLVHRLTSILLAVVMLVSMVTPGVQAVTGDTLTTTEIESDLGNDSDDSTETSQKETPEIKFATTKITLSVDKDGKAITNAINRIQTGVSGATYEYKSDDDSIVKVDKYGVLIPVGKGETKIKVTSSETNKYFSATAEYDVEVVEAENDLRWKNTKPWENTDSWSVAWNDENGFSNQVVQVIDGQENEVSDVSYSSDSTSVATVNEEGQIELIKPGTVVITATKGDASISYVLVVAKADRIIGFADSEPKTNAVTSIRNEITEITPLVEGEKPEIRYSIRKDKNSTEEIATIDEEGLVTPKKFGKVTILAEIASDAYCNYAYAECTLVIERAKLETFRFDLTEVTTNEAGYIIKKTGANFEEPSLENSENGTITYSVFEDKNKVVDSIDKETGDITFKNNTGIVTICATRAQDDKYEEAEAYYTIEVEDAKFEGEPFYTIDGEKDAKSGWYKSDVSIKANEGYSISTDKKNWGYCLAVTEDGKHTVCFYLKHEKSGIIYEKQEVEIKKDATKPTVTINSETLSWWDQIWYWGKDTKITIEGKDDLSDVKTTEYVIKKVEELNDNSRPEDFEGWKTYEGEIRVSSGKVIVYAKVTDKAGNCEYGQTNAFIVDDKAPDISYEIQTSDYKEFYKDNVEISVDVKDEGTSIGIKKVSYKVFDGDDVVKEDNLFETENGIISQWKSNDFEKNIIVDSAFNSDYIKVEITAVDNAGNDNTAEIFLKICVDEPSIDVEDIEDYSASVVPLEGIDYLSKDRRVKITINQRKSVFEASDRPKITILETIDGVSQKYTSNEEEFKQFIESDWELSMEQQKLSLKFSNDASYEFSIEYEDVLDNKCTDGSDSKFVIDKTAPNASVTIDENSTWDKLLEILTFGLWKNKAVKVEVDCKDLTTPIKKIEYYISDSVDKMDKVALDALYKDGKFSKFEDQNIEKNKGKASLTVEEEGRFVIYVRVENILGQYMYICSDGYVIDKTKADVEITLPETNIKHDDKPVYNTDVVVDINVTEKKDDLCSGIKEIKYEIYCDNKITKEEVLYTFEYDMSNYAPESADVPSYDELCHNFKEQITIEAEANNSCNVALKVIVTDNAGNVLEETKELDIDVTAPTVEMTYKDEKAINKTEGDKGYFSGDRTATIVITEREGHFNAEKATKGIKIKAVDAKDKPIAVNNEQLEVDTKGYIVDISKLFGEIEWITSVNEEAPEATMHTLVLNFEKDANYTVDGNYVYTDLAGKASSGVDTGNSVTPYNFAVDKTAPTDLTIKINNESIFGTDSVTFNKFYGNTVEIKLNANCDISGLESLQYQKVASVSDYKVNGDWVEYNAENGILVSPSEKFVIYFRAEDKAGNVAIVNSTGVVVDNKEPVGETKAPEIDIIPMKPNAYGFYNGNVVVDVKVVDPKYVGENVSTNGFYSGLSKIEYNIYATDTGAVENGVLLDIKSSSNVEGAEFDADNLIKAWKGNINIAADKFNSNNVIVEIVAIDNAGNERASKTVNGDIKIDITPSKIAVSYDNNEGDVSFAESVYFKADRTATIVVTERNFSPELFKIKITNTDGYIPVISKWETKVGTMENGDDTTYTATIVFDNDGDYRFDIESCFDKAMNQNVAPDSGESLAPWSFTIDKTLPVVNVYYDNDDVLNGNYYKDQRIATVTVTEHNFETDRVKISLDATDSGTKIALPVVSNWASNGDVHTLTISYTADARYVFDFDYTDKAGNQISDFAEQTFYVDKTEPVISIEKIVDESANNTEGNIGFVITATDTNFDVFTPVLTAVLKNGNAFETKQLEIGEITNVKNGKVFTVTNVENDGIYRITCTLVDKAGNAYSKVTLERADGNKYDEKRFGEDVLLTFSVNRNGSAFEIDENTTELVEKYYTQNVENDIVVVEINADPLKEYNATLNGKTLVKGTDYTVTEEGGNGAWKKYTYKIKKMLFNDEGEYKLVVSSKDKADNNAFSDVKDTTIEFVIDRTAPVVTVSGLATDGRYQTERQRVTLIPTDDGGALQTIIVNMVAEDGKVIKEVVNLTGEALLKELEANEGKITFEIAEGLYQNVQIICTDRATGEGTNTNVYDTTIKNVSVSSNAFMIFWANTVARYATIIGGTILIVGAVVVIVLIKRKKNNK